MNIFVAIVIKIIDWQIRLTKVMISINYPVRMNYINYFVEESLVYYVNYFRSLIVQLLEMRYKSFFYLLTNVYLLTAEIRTLHCTVGTNIS